MVSYNCLIKIMVIVELFWKTEIYGHTVPENISTILNIDSNKDSNTLFDLLDIAENVLHAAKRYVKAETNKHSKIPDNLMDCAEILEYNSSLKSGIYKIRPRSRAARGPISVYCDMDDDGGAWTVIQRRGDFDRPKDYFYRDWRSYKHGFGDISQDFWIGNDNIFMLTNERANSVKFTLIDWEGNATYALYDDFYIDDETRNYMMHVEGYRGTAGDSFSNTNNVPFTTKDKDNDEISENCAVIYKGAWWYKACHASNLNGYYFKGAHDSYADGVNWNSFKGLHYSLKDTVIKIRPKDFRKKNN